jgi:periplasmic divalent cation tolerance protein
MTDKIVVLCTCGNETEADALARSLVDARLAACVNILPRIRSVYRWNGAVESAEEWLLIIKTARGLFAAVQSTVGKLHSYEIPELLAIPLVDGAPNYLAWMESCLKGPEAA